MSQVSKFIRNVTGQTAKRKAEEIAGQQTDLLNQQREQLKKANDAFEAEKKANQKKSNEKQIRALRSTFRTPSFSESQNTEPKEKLG